MSNHFQLWILVGFLFFFFILGLFFLISISSKEKRMRRRPLKTAAPEKEQQDWKAAALRLERLIVDLRQDNVSWQKKVKALEKEGDVYRQKQAALDEQLRREREWKQKEEADLDKRGSRIQKLEQELKQVERRTENEHAELLLLRRENQDLTAKVTKDSEQIKALEIKADKIQAQADSYRKEILDLRAENKKLSQRHEDVQWIAKSVHLKVKEELRLKAQEVDRLKQDLNRQ